MLLVPFASFLSRTCVWVFRLLKFSDLDSSGKDLVPLTIFLGQWHLEDRSILGAGWGSLSNPWSWRSYNNTRTGMKKMIVQVNKISNHNILSILGNRNNIPTVSLCLLVVSGPNQLFSLSRTCHKMSIQSPLENFKPYGILQINVSDRYFRKATKGGYYNWAN